jgi:site-specific DNA recombinase
VVPERPLKDQKYKKIEKTSRKIRPKETWYSISVPSLIDKELFEKAQRQLKANYVLMQRNKKNEYLLGGMIRCACGRTRSGEGPMKGKHLYYRCSDRVMNYPLPRTCVDGRINARITDELVWSRLSEIMVSPEILIKYRNQWCESQQKPVMPTGDTNAIKREIEKLKHEESRYTKAYGTGIFTVEQLKEYVVPLREKIASLELQFTQTAQVRETVAVSLPTEEEIRAGVDVSKDLENLGFTQKRAIVANVVEKVIATQKQVTVHGRIAIPFKHVELRSNYQEVSIPEITSNINKNHVEYKTSYRDTRLATYGNGRLERRDEPCWHRRGRRECVACMAYYFRS